MTVTQKMLEMLTNQIHRDGQHLLLLRFDLPFGRDVRYRVTWQGAAHG